MFQKILVPLDGTDLAEGILPFVSQLAGGLKTPIVLLSVVGPESITVTSGRPPKGPWIETLGERGAVDLRQLISTRDEHSPFPHASGSGYAAQLTRKAQMSADNRIGEIVKQLNKEGLRSKSIVEIGDAAESIVRIAEREGCDLIAMSTHGRSMLGRGILGSVTDKVLHSSHVPVLTITPDKAKRYQQGDAKITKVIVPLDGSTLAESALPYVEVLAQSLSLEVLLVRVVKFDGFYSVDIGGYPAARGADIDTMLAEAAIEYLKGVSGRLTAKGLNVEWKLLRGEPGRSLVEFAQESTHDLVVLSSHGRSGLTRWALGSVAEALVRASGDPLLIIPPSQKAS